MVGMRPFISRLLDQCGMSSVVDSTCVEGSFKCTGDPCERPPCKEDEFLCVDGSKCINTHFKCDHTPDCDDKSDEAGCGELQLRVFRRSYFALGIIDETLTCTIAYESRNTDYDGNTNDNDYDGNNDGNDYDGNILTIMNMMVIMTVITMMVIMTVITIMVIIMVMTVITIMVIVT